MANIRVYELARDLTVTNKVLIKTIREMNITVKSHMSSLDKETEEKIRDNFYGKKPDTVEVTRVRPTVIRRRKKTVPEKPVKPEVEEPAPETVAEPVLEKPVAEPARPAVADMPKAPVKKRAAPPKGEAARIIAAVKPPAEKAAEVKPAAPEAADGQTAEAADVATPATEPVETVDIKEKPAVEAMVEKNHSTAHRRTGTDGNNGKRRSVDYQTSETRQTGSKKEKRIRCQDYKTGTGCTNNYPAPVSQTERPPQKVCNRHSPAGTPAPPGKNGGDRCG